MMEDYERPDDREGMGCIAWTMATIALALALVMFSCGCEDEGDDTTVDNSINVPTNGTATVGTVSVNGDSNTTIVYIETSPGISQVYQVDVTGKSNYLGFVVKQPSIQTEPPADE